MAFKKFKGVFTPEEYDLLIEEYNNKINSYELKKNKIKMEKASFEAYYKNQIFEENKFKGDEDYE